MATKPRITLTSPRGRMVQGDAFEAQTTDQQGQPLTIKTGPNAGQPTKRWFLAVAYSKTDPAVLPYLMELAKFSAQCWPQYFPNGAQPTPPLFGCTHPRFSFKIADGDGVDDNGKPNASKPGFAGHWIVKYSTSLQAPGVWQEPNYDEMARISDPRALPCGYFVRVFHSVESNGNDQRPGQFVNLDKVSICADQQGAEIIQRGPSAADAFGGGMTHSAPAAPPTPAPAAGAPVPAGLQPVQGAAHSIEALRQAGWTDDQIVQGGYATRPAPLPAAPPAPAPAATPAAPTPPVAATATASPSEPYSGFMAPAGRVMLPAANGATYEQMIAAGWTDAMLVQHGMMQA